MISRILLYCAAVWAQPQGNDNEEAKTMSLFWGIDLGSANTASAIILPKYNFSPQNFPVWDGNRTAPSQCYYEKVSVDKSSLKPHSTMNPPMRQVHSTSSINEGSDDADSATELFCKYACRDALKCVSSIKLEGVVFFNKQLLGEYAEKALLIDGLIDKLTEMGIDKKQLTSEDSSLDIKMILSQFQESFAKHKEKYRLRIMTNLQDKPDATDKFDELVESKFAAHDPSSILETLYEAKRTLQKNQEMVGSKLGITFERMASDILGYVHKCLLQERKEFSPEELQKTAKYIACAVAIPFECTQSLKKRFATCVANFFDNLLGSHCRAVYLVSEPLCAALTIRLPHNKSIRKQIDIVIDIGASTLDICAVRHEQIDESSKPPVAPSTEMQTPEEMADQLESTLMAGGKIGPDDIAKLRAQIDFEEKRQLYLRTMLSNADLKSRGLKQRMTILYGTGDCCIGGYSCIQQVENYIRNKLSERFAKVGLGQYTSDLLNLADVPLKLRDISESIMHSLTQCSSEDILISDIIFPSAILEFCNAKGIMHPRGTKYEEDDLTTVVETLELSSTVMNEQFGDIITRFSMVVKRALAACNAQPEQICFVLNGGTSRMKWVSQALLTTFADFFNLDEVHLSIISRSIDPLTAVSCGATSFIKELYHQDNIYSYIIDSSWYTDARKLRDK